MKSSENYTNILDNDYIDVLDNIEINQIDWSIKINWNKQEQKYKKNKIILFIKNIKLFLKKLFFKSKLEKNKKILNTTKNKYPNENIIDLKCENKREKYYILPKIIFLFKYILTSSFIFLILMISTNYNAYLNVIQNYINKEKINTERKWLISSVEASNIKEKNIKNNIPSLKKSKNTNNQSSKNIEQNEKQRKKRKNLSEYSINKLITLTNKKNINLDINITPYGNRILIPKMWKNVPLLDIKNQKISWEKELNNIFMKELENWVIRYPWSSKPWEIGNTFIFWHSSNFPWIKWNFNDVFSLLDSVVYNDIIIVYYWQKKYTYKIREKKIINPGNVELLNRNKNKSELTIMTCWPIWTTLKRLVVTWTLVEDV